MLHEPAVFVIILGDNGGSRIFWNSSTLLPRWHGITAQNTAIFIVREIKIGFWKLISSATKKKNSCLFIQLMRWCLSHFYITWICSCVAHKSFVVPEQSLIIFMLSQCIACNMLLLRCFILSDLWSAFMVSFLILPQLLLLLWTLSSFCYMQQENVQYYPKSS